MGDQPEMTPTAAAESLHRKEDRQVVGGSAATEGNNDGHL